MVEKHTISWNMPFVDGERDLNGEEILPIGNGKLGGVMWMPHDDTFCLQLNHVDYWRGGDEVLEEDREFGGRPVSPGRLTLSREGGFGSEKGSYRQELSLARGRLTTSVEREETATLIEATGDMEGETLLIRWREFGSNPVGGSVTLEGWRVGIEAAINEDRAVLTEKAVNTRVAHEEAYLRELGIPFKKEVHAQATVVSIEGAAVSARVDGKKAILDFEGKAGFDVVIRVITSIDSAGDRALGISLDRLAEAGKDSWERADERNAAWWKAFWERSHVSMESDDGSAERFSRYWHVCLYLMAIGNRGKRPIKFNLGNWIAKTNEKRQWSGGYWYYNERDFVAAMMSANHTELARNFFAQYLNNADTMRSQCRQLWGHAGLFVAETTSPDGTMYLRDRTGIHDGRTKMIQLIFSTSLEVSFNLYQYSRYTGDDDLCRTRVYPFMRDVVAFFRIHMFKDDDGKYHIYPANGHETFWRVKDDLPDLAGLRAVLPILIELSERYGLDEREREQWREFLENLAEMP
ncbi:MAG: hypothetical protein GF344_06120, partial [Chitinivibrionales bacterium]|nr:hypothetical protein [Chitinivibrionales bacterium]MBD3356517.1 hypothetical protein [Chitinivibrionales bacterium]